MNQWDQNWAGPPKPKRKNRTWIYIGLALAGFGLVVTLLNRPHTTTPKTATSVQLVEEPANIPGLTAADVSRNLMPRGFICDGPGNTTGGGLTYQCTRRDPAAKVFERVLFQGHNPTSIYRVTAEYENYNDDSESGAKAFLGYVATLPYDGSQPQQAKDWVASSLNGDQSKFGPAVFQIVKAPTGRAWTLTISTP